MQDNYCATVKRRRFSVIYAEKESLDYPIARHILEKYPDCPVILIEQYKHVFHRHNQNFRWQKSHPALILAVKKPPFLYDGPPVCQSFGCKHFYYSSPLMNCPFDCSYCFLQAMFPSAYTVAFVNLSDFAREIADTAKRHAPDKVYIAASYDTDLAAFQSVYPYQEALVSELVDYDASVAKNLVLEFRTKSADSSFFRHHPRSVTSAEILSALVFAFTLSPDACIERYERGTPRLDSRMAAIRIAQASGYSIRLCFDPVFPEKDLLPLYPTFFDRVFGGLNGEQILDVSHGFFRMSDEYFRRIKRANPGSRLFSQAFPRGDVVSYDADLCAEIRAEHVALLSQYIDKERIFT